MPMAIIPAVDHRSPLERRWGGWYVTRKHGSARHLGNAVATDSEQPLSMVSDATLNLESLEGRFDTHAYLSPHSDIVALMVLDHQVHMTNLITHMGWETRLALHHKQLMENSTDYPPADQDRNLLARRLGDAAREFVDYLLFIDEAPLTGNIQGTSGFAEKFAAQGPRDSQGRSLRQFDLESMMRQTAPNCAVFEVSARCSWGVLSAPNLIPAVHGYSRQIPAVYGVFPEVSRTRLPPHRRIRDR
jgi:hypothetical protein